MSLSFADNSYIGVISEWITNHQWVGSGQQQSILVVQADDATQQYNIISGFGDLEISASYMSGVDELGNLTVSLNVPEYGLVLLAEESSYPLSADPGQNLTISVAGDITGSVSFKYVGDGNDTEVFSDYVLDVPYSPTLEDSISIFPVDFQRVTTIESPQSSSFKRSKQKADARLETRTGDQDQGLVDFLSDYAKDGDKILIPTYYSQGTSDTAPSKQYTVDVSFLVFQLVGSIDPELSMSATLYAKIPILGRVELARLEGALDSGITVGINLVIAKGTVKVTAEQNSVAKHRVYINIDLDIKFLKHFAINNFTLSTLPF